MRKFGITYVRLPARVIQLNPFFIVSEFLEHNRGIAVGMENGFSEFRQSRKHSARTRLYIRSLARSLTKHSPSLSAKLDYSHDFSQPAFPLPEKGSR